MPIRHSDIPLIDKKTAGSPAMLPVSDTELAADAPAAVLPKIESVSEIVIEAEKVRLRIIGAPAPQTVQLILQQLLR